MYAFNDVAIFDSYFHSSYSNSFLKSHSFSNFCFLRTKKVVPVEFELLSVINFHHIKSLIDRMCVHQLFEANQNISPNKSETNKLWFIRQTFQWNCIWCIGDCISGRQNIVCAFQALSEWIESIYVVLSISIATNTNVTLNAQIYNVRKDKNHGKRILWSSIHWIYASSKLNWIKLTCNRKKLMEKSERCRFICDRLCK